MKITSNKSLLLADTQVSDIFISEYFADIDGDFVKVYLYCLYLEKFGKEIDVLDLAKKTGLELARVKQAMDYLNGAGLIIASENGIMLCDLKEKEITKLYRPKLSNSPEEAEKTLKVNKKRSEVVTMINNTFFQGIMNTSWYNDISTIFDKYGFEEDVVYSLFKYCYDKHALHKKYLFTVADAWYQNKIKNLDDLDRYYSEYEKTNKIKKQITKKLGFTRNLTEYEEAYIEKWTMEFGYDLSLIELALKKTTSKSNPNFEYINKIITDWNEKGLKTKEAIEEYSKQVVEKNKFIKQNKDTNAYVNTDQQEYNDLDRFYL
ncbi:MAG: DnaD domain protein [Clostridia bacterium]|nr:DnaD domain protein [Clostridia bacterium]